MHLECTVERHADAVVVTPAGEIDRDTAGHLRRRLAEAVGLAGTGIVDVDLRHVTFMDSSGIGALLAGRRLAGDAGATLRVRDPGPPVRTVLELTNVWNLLRS
jgi:anti-sigma B factor antagonist